MGHFPPVRLVVVLAVSLHLAGCAQERTSQPGTADPTTGAVVSLCGSRDIGSFGTVAAVADVDRDGRDDLVALVTTAGSGAAKTVAVLRGGRSEPDLSATVEADYVAVADLDGDGLPDLVATRGDWTDSSLLFLRGRGDGTFDQPSALPISGHRVTAVDVNGDGIPDLVTWRYTNPSQESLFVALGRGDGTFEPVDGSTAVPNAIFRDMDGDGRADLVVVTDIKTPYWSAATGITLWTYRSLGDGAFGDPQKLEIEGLYVESLEIADLDGDGRVDLALVVRPDPQDLSVTRLAVLYAAPGGFEAPVWYPFPGHAWGLTTGLVTGGRRPDLIASVDTGVAGYTGEGGAILFAATGVRAFAPAQVLDFPTKGAAVFVRDLDRDGRDELVAVTPTSLATFSTACTP